MPADLAVTGQQLAKLVVHVVQIFVPIALFRTAAGYARAAARIVIRIVPIQLRVIKEQLHALPMAFVRQHLEHVLVIRRAVYDVPIALLGAPHREPVVMLAGDGDIFHPGVFRHRNPFGRVELGGIELRRQFFIIRHGDLFVVHHPFAAAENAVDAPMDKESELVVLEPLARFQILRSGLVVLRHGGRPQKHQQEIVSYQ